MVYFFKFNYYSLNNVPEITSWENKIFRASFYTFEGLALELFQFQYNNNPLYRQFCDSLQIDPLKVDHIVKIPFMPVQLFKTHEIKTTEFEAETVFESSGTTGSATSRHFIKNTQLYTDSFTHAFELFYGNPSEWCVLGLLPSYLERGHSSLVYMVENLIQQSGHPFSGFYLADHEKLYHTLLHNEIIRQPTLLIGVTYGLLDFAANYKMRLSNTIIMETGGMKGRRAEITREEVHAILKSQLGISEIHSEYGMTELLSQAYSRKEGLFKCPPWMEVLIREEDDPMAVYRSPKAKTAITGVVNIIDLANIYSCAFLATNDIGKLHHNGFFEILGRTDASEIRGCSLLTL